MFNFGVHLPKENFYWSSLSNCSLLLQVNSRNPSVVGSFAAQSCSLADFRGAVGGMLAATRFTAGIAVSFGSGILSYQQQLPPILRLNQRVP
jgi:hypothetical protein